MVPMPVWRYIIARVREDFPDTVFLLDHEAAGGLKMTEYYQWIQDKMPGAP